MSEQEQIEQKLSQALVSIKEAVDLSLQLMLKGQEQSKMITVIWEKFLKEFLTYIKFKSRETGRNLFAAISFQRVWPR